MHLLPLLADTLVRVGDLRDAIRVAEEGLGMTSRSVERVQTPERVHLLTTLGTARWLGGEAETGRRTLLDALLLAREGRAPAWRTLLGIYRQLEARGEIRGGRFVAGFVGEQFALPEAVDALRAVRRKKDEGEMLIIAAADPLNLVGILTPGARVSPFSGQVIAYRAGVPVEVGDLGAIIHRVRQIAPAPGA